MIPRRVFAVMSLALLAACSPKLEKAPETPSPAVHTLVVDASSEGPLEARGTIQADARLRLGFKLPGVLAEVHVKEGDEVRKGQLLARLDQTDALSQVRLAGARRSVARRDAVQTSQLAKAGAVPESNRDDAMSSFESADAGLNMAIDAWKGTRLIAPISGRVVQRLAQPGETIAAGFPVLVVDHTENLIVRVGVTLRDLDRLDVGQTVTLKPEDGGRILKGKVSSLAPSPNPADGLYGVEIQPEQQSLQSGSLISVRFDEAKAEPMIRIPLEAIVRRQDKDWVFVVEGNGDQAVARIRSIDKARTSGREVTVRDGLKRGERIIMEGAYFLQDGQPVRLLETQPSADPQFRSDQRG